MKNMNMQNLSHCRLKALGEVFVLEHRKESKSFSVSNRPHKNGKMLIDLTQHTTRCSDGSG